MYFEYPLLAKHSPQYLMSSEQCGTVPCECGRVCSLCSVLMDVVMKPVITMEVTGDKSTAHSSCLHVAYDFHYTKCRISEETEHSENSYWYSSWSASFPILLCQNCHFFFYLPVDYLHISQQSPFRMDFVSVMSICPFLKPSYLLSFSVLLANQIVSVLFY